jgi:hypothetical protein
LGNNCNNIEKNSKFYLRQDVNKTTNAQQQLHEVQGFSGIAVSH